MGATIALTYSLKVVSDTDGDNYAEEKNMIRDHNVDENADIAAHKIQGGLGHPLRDNARALYVDMDYGNDGNSGLNRGEAKQTIQNAVDAANAWDDIYIFPGNIGSTATDPASYAETVVIPVEKEGLRLIGVGTGRTQGGLPQIEIGAGTTALLTIRAANCLIANLGFNGASSTGGGISLDDDGTTKVAFGTTIQNCHFKNCQTSATVATAGGAIYAAAGGAWQLLVDNCRFYKCRGGIVCVNTTTVPQDWVIQYCVFGSSVKTEIDADIYFPADGVLGVDISHCRFDTVDVPASSGGAYSRYIQMGGGNFGAINDCTFACTVQGSGAKTFGATGNACVIPTTVRIAGCFGECESTSASNAVRRTL